MDRKQFITKLLNWFSHNGRHDLPWQKRPTPYRVWVSEIMLQQTQVQTVIPYFQKFMSRFPNLKSLALAEQDEVLSHWSGLGYYARARNLHLSAQIIHQQHSGRFPKTVDELCTLPGIGRSTAGAILSLAMQQPAAILDGNVKRVLTRFYGIHGWPGDSKIQQQLWQLALHNTPKQNTAAYNQAMMDLGATICSRKLPKCKACPLQKGCHAKQHNLTTLLPTAKPKSTRPLKKTMMLILRNDKGEILLEKRPPVGIWGGLFSFPQCAIDQDIKIFCTKQLQCQVKRYNTLNIITHQFSHFKLEITPVLLDVKAIATQVMESKARVWYNKSAALPGGIATPVSRLLQQLD